jgi:hypothetical protein
MNLVNYIWLYFWVAPHLLLLVVAVLMLRRRLHKSFPFFFLYLLFEFLKFVALFTLHWLKIPPLVYIKVDVLDRAVSIALHFGILRELFFAPVINGVLLHRNISRLLNWVTAVMIVLASVFIGATYYGSLNYPIPNAYVVVEALNTSQCGLLVLVFLWHAFLGVRMSPMAFGISVGMGMAFGLEPFILLFKNHVPRPMFRLVDIFQMGVFHIAVLIWIYYTQVKESGPVPPEVNQSQWLEQAAKLERMV